MKIPKIINQAITIPAGSKSVFIGEIVEVKDAKILAVLTKSSEVGTVQLSLKTAGQVAMIDKVPARLFDPEVTNGILEIETPEVISWAKSEAILPAVLGVAATFNLTIIFK